MPVILGRIVANIIPRRFFANEFMRLIHEFDVPIKRICRNWKTILGREYFTQRGAAYFAETPAIDIRADGFENANGLLT